MKRIFTAIIALTACANAFALTTSVSGNPIKRQDDYSINTNVARWIDVGCTFINTSNKPAKLTLWTNPEATIPFMTIHLKRASKNFPNKIHRSLHLQLKKNWWCPMGAPKKETKKWAYCSYLSISDATITRSRAFKTWNKTIHSKHTRYHCYLKHPNGRISFFNF